MKLETIKMAWDMMSKHERKIGYLVLLVSIFGAIAQVAIIGSVMPFLNFMTRSENGVNSATINWLMEVFQIEDQYYFAIILGLFSIGVIWVCNFVLIIRSYMIARFTTMRVHSISVNLVRSYLKQDYEYFLNRNSNDFSKRILSETAEISNSFLRPLAEFISSILSSVAIVGLLIYVNPVGTFVATGTVIAVYLIMNNISKRVQKRFGEERVIANKRRFELIGEMFDGIKVVKTAGLEFDYVKRFEDVSSITHKAIWKSRVISETPQFMVQTFFLSGIILACLCLIEKDFFVSGNGGLESLIPMLGIFAFAGMRILPELHKVYAASSKIGFGAASIENVNEDFQRVEMKRNDEIYDIGNVDMIELRGVGYQYPGSTNGLTDISLDIRKGQRIGIVGGTGSGKTTLVDILLGLLKPQTGSLCVNGLDLKNETMLRGWKKKCAYVPQDVFLKDGTIAENITLGSDFVDHSRIKACAKIAQIHDFIVESTGDGYEALTGQHGIMLSGGQKQRIGIARALYQGAQFIVMDEATSALDPHTEKLVMQEINEKMPGVTMVFIAHRLGTVRSCDKLFVLEKGRLSGAGTWDELMESNVVFSDIVADYQDGRI